MAFNPFTSFRKYQKYWMAGAVLTCMLTFVLCSGGIRGTGLDDWFLRVFGHRRSEALVTINGHKYYYDDLNEIKTQRNVANDFMQELSRTAITRLEATIKQAKSEEKSHDDRTKALLSLSQKCLEDLFTKLGRDPRYFSGGTKLDELIDFILWRDVADKYGVQLTDDVVDTFVLYACHGQFWRFDAETSREVEAKVRATHYNVTEQIIRQALKQEFRVQIAQLALAARWSPGPGNERDQYANIQLPEGYVHIYLNTPLQMRIAPTPEEISAKYRNMRTEVTFELLPISLAALAKDVKLPEAPAARLELLKKFYDDYAKKEYNPTLDTPGFLLPSRAEIQFFNADAGMDYYKQPAQAATVLKKTPPVAYNPLSPLAGALGFLATGPAWQAALERNLEAERNQVKEIWNQYHKSLIARYDQYLAEANAKMKEDIKLVYDINLKRPPLPYKDSASSWTNPRYYSPGQYRNALDKPNAAMVAALLGGASGEPLAGLVAYQAGAYEAQAKKIASMATHDRATRTQVGVDLFLAQTPQLFGGGPFTAAGLTYYADLKPELLPIAGYIEKDLQAKLEERQAQAWVNKTMLDVKKQLEAVKGRDFAFRDQVDKLKAKYSREDVEKDGKKQIVSGLHFGETAYPRSEYDVEFDDNLQPLLRGFEKDRVTVNLIEGRAGKPELLREGDFAKLFFGAENLGVGPQNTFMPKTWPPTVTVPKLQQKNLAQKSLEQRLFDDADKPIVFWKSSQRNKEAMEWRPEDSKMLDFVEKQYRLNEARVKLLEQVKKIADEVNKAQRSEGRDLSTTLQELAKQYDTKVVKLDRVATMVENPDRKTADTMPYVEYALPRERIPFARGDMVKDLLSLRNLSAPLKLDLEDVDKQNKTPAGEAAAKRAKADLDELTKLNEGLFRKELVNNPKMKSTAQIQLLTNKPRSIVYIATVTVSTEPSVSETLLQAWHKGSMQTAFVDQVQHDQGKDLMKLLAQYLRAQANVEPPSAEARKQFGDDSPGQ